MHTQTTAYELKYCERCGSLGLRRVSSAETYCRPCGHLLTNVVALGNRPPLRAPAAKSSLADEIAPLVFHAAAQSQAVLRRLP